MSRSRSKGTAFFAASSSRPVFATRSKTVGTHVVSISAGENPISPSMTAPSVACPRPVAPRLPMSSQKTRAVRSRQLRLSSSCTKRSAARMGPTVWLELGPMPTLKRSKTLLAMIANVREKKLCSIKASIERQMKRQLIGMLGESNLPSEIALRSA